MHTTWTTGQLCDEVTHVLFVTNHGPDIVDNPSVRIDLPESLVLIDTVLTGDSSCQYNTLHQLDCEMSQLGVDETQQITLYSIPQEAGVFTTVASVSSDQEDRNLSNNQVEMNNEVLLFGQGTNEPILVPTLDLKAKMLLMFILLITGRYALRSYQFN